MKQVEKTPQSPEFHWQQIETVMLDMDGTLLDSYFDDFFWEEYVPQIFARENNMDITQARKTLLAKYQRVEKTLQWSDVDYWSEQLGLDIPELKCKVDHLIRVHPYVLDFLDHMKSLGKPIYLVTNAHSKTLEIKLNKTAIGPYFTRIIPAEEIGWAKEQPPFWEELNMRLGFNTATTMLVDDNSNVLRAAAEYGLQHLIYVAKPNSRSPVRYSDEFPSIVYFNELIF